MKIQRCVCGRQLDSSRKAALNLYLSDHTCDVYGCANNDDDRRHGSHWTYQTTPQTSGPQIRYSNRSPPSRKKRNDYSMSVFQYFIQHVSKSSINGFSNLVSASNIVSRIVWFLVFTGSIVGFSYQASHFYQLYKSKPTVVQIEVENDGEVDFPAVTICNTNRIRRSAFCKHFGERCKEGTTNLSELQINELTYQLLLDGKDDVKMDLGHTKSMFVDCDFIGTPIVQGDECKSILEPYYDPDYGNCYTFTSKFKSDLSLQARKVDFWQEENDLSLVMDVEPEEFMERKRNPGLIAIVHDENNLPDIHTEGIHLLPGFSYTITVSKTTVLLLPLPFKTNCTDYQELKWKNLHRRRLTSRLCTVGCSQYFQLQQCKFVTKNLSLFYKSLPYSRIDETEEKNQCAKNEENRTLGYCRSICGLPCRDTVFVPTVSFTKLTPKELSSALANRGDHNNMSIYDDIVRARVFYSTLEHKIYRHMPKYDTMELFSYLGGYSGVWLGFSLLTVYELIEIIISTVLFFFRKRLRSQQQKKMVHAIAHSKNIAKTGGQTQRRRKHYR